MAKWIGRLAVAAAGLGAVAAFVAAQRRRWMDLKGRVVVITGGSRGLGLEMARVFARKGARLALLARNEEELQSASAEIAVLGADVLWLRCDIRRQENVNQAIVAVSQRFGRIDVLVNNAGIIQVGPLEHMELDDFRNAMDVHFWGPLYAIRAVVPQMKEQGGGRIVNVSSIGGLVAVPHLSPYCASKFALVGLSDALRSELAPAGIRVTTVCPGLMRTGSHLNATFKGKHHEEFAWFAVGGSMPGSSMSSDTAALQIVNACQKGAAKVVLSIPANLLALSGAVAPGILAEALELVNRLLPRATTAQGDEIEPGWQVQAPGFPNSITRLSEQAADRNNERIAARNGHGKTA